jgi:hypothetical protein
MSSPGKPLTGKKAAAVLHLASGMSNESVAAAVKVSVRSLQRWKLTPDFIAELKAVRARLHYDAAQRTTDMIRQLLPSSVGVLAQSLKSPSERVRLGAVEAVFAWYGRLFEQHTLTEQMAELRAMYKEMKRRDRPHGRLDPYRNGYAS